MSRVLRPACVASIKILTGFSRSSVRSLVCNFSVRMSSSDSPVDVSAMRQSYDVGVLTEDDLISKEPIAQFDAWIKEATKIDPAIIGEANAMVLATSSRDGIPSVRYVLLKGYGKEGFTFYTNYNSLKGKQLAENPHASLLFYWHPMQRQVRIDGSVVKLSAERNDKYFHERPKGSQLGAIASNQGEVIPSRQFLHEKAENLQKEYAGDDKVIPRPDWWGGYTVVPQRVEFWQGCTNRLHDRIVFRRPEPGEEVAEDGHTKRGTEGWVYERLSA